LEQIARGIHQAWGEGIGTAAPPSTGRADDERMEFLDLWLHARAHGLGKSRERVFRSDHTLTHRHRYFPELLPMSPDSFVY
jgi:hypothetical protein